MELPDELQPLVEISEQDWALIEHLAHLAGQGYTEPKDIYLAGCIEADRARQMIELNSAAIINIIHHLAIFRRSDLAESLEIIDHDFSFTHEILQRYIKQTQRIKPSQREGQAYLAQMWQQALARPADTMTLLRGLGANLAAAAPAEQAKQVRQSDAVVLPAPAEQGRIRAAMATLLGIDHRLPLAELRTAIAERQHLLFDRLDPLHGQAEQWTGPAAAAVELTDVIGAYQGPTALLSDARAAGGWAELADGLGVSDAAAIGAYRQMAGLEDEDEDEAEPPPQREPTSAEDELLQWIAGYMQANGGRSPGIGELCQGLSIERHHVTYRLSGLQAAGRLDWTVASRTKGREFRIPGMG